MECFGRGREASYAAVVFQKAYQESDLRLAERLRQRGQKVILDLCDNHLYVPEDAPELAARASRLKQMIDLANFVCVSSAPLGEVLGQTLGRPVDVVIEDYLDQLPARSWGRWLVPIEDRRFSLRADGLRLLWFGTAGSATPPFGMLGLARIMPELNELAGDVPLSLTVISNSRDAFTRFTSTATFPTRYATWRASTFALRVQRHDVVILPIDDNPFTRCKTANRIALSFSLAGC